MFSITREAVPADALLLTYRGGIHPDRWGRYADCFSVPVDRVVSLADFVFAFYTSPVFRIERWLLRAFLGATSSDTETRALANGSAASFAVWYVGARTPTELLMCDRYERTRSWFRATPASGSSTLLQFGSAVAAARERNAGGSALGSRFRLLMGFHVLYSQVLLNSARSGVLKAESA